MTILHFIQMWKTLFWRKYAIFAGLGKIFSFISIFLFNEKKIYLAVLDLSFDMQTLSCSMWDIVPWTWIEPRLPALGAVAPDAKRWLIWKDPGAGKDWGQEKGSTQDEKVGWPHRLNGHEFG